MAEGARASVRGLDALLAPRSLAVVGASDDPTRIGGRPLAYMRARGYAGALWPVNPRRDRVQGLTAYPGVGELPGAPEAAVVAVPGEAAEAAVEALGARGCRAAVVFTAGFAEADAAGAAAEARLVAAARRHGLRLLGPNCLGLFNAPLGYFPIFSSSFENGWPTEPPAGRGRVGIVSQSGAYGTHVFAAARERGIATPVLVTTGNEAEVTTGDLIAWMAGSDAVEVLAVYLEGVRDGPGLAEALEAARRARKPVVAMKVGRSALGARAALSHTASVAGDDAVMGAVLDEFGVHRARTTEEMLDVAYAATPRLYPCPNALGVLTISGGAGVLISDAAEAAGLPMPPMPEASRSRLRGLVPFCNPANPVDCTAQVFNDASLIGAFGRELAAEGGYPSLLGFFTQLGASPSIAPAILSQMRAVRAAHPDRLWSLCVLAPPERVRAYDAEGFLVFEDPSRAVLALAAQGRFGEAFARPPRAPPPALDLPLPAEAADEAGAAALLAAAGVPVVPHRAAGSAGAAAAAARDLGFPVALKLLSPDLAHKSEVGGVLLGLEDEAAVRAGWETLTRRAAERAPGARVRGVLVARMLRGGLAELSMGVARDPVFGPVVAVATGGIHVEVLRDAVVRRCPVDEAEAEAMIRALRGFPLLDGARGRPRADLPALARALSALSRLGAGAGPRLLSLEANPVIALPEGEGAFAADAALALAPLSPEPA